MSVKHGALEEGRAGMESKRATHSHVSLSGLINLSKVSVLIHTVVIC